MTAASDREIVRLLRRLGSRPDAAGDAPPELTDGLLRRGLIAPAGAGLALTGAGRAYLRRALADPGDFAAQHQARAEATVEDAFFGRMRVTVNGDESPLARLRRQKGKDGRPLVDAAGFTAGERLRSDYTRGQIMQRVTANWTATVADSRREGGMADLTDAAISARQRVERALIAVGPEFSGILVDFCCFLKGIEEIERERAWPVRSAKLVIRLGLASLARHYGLTPQARGAPTSMRHWGSDDYRPVIDPPGDDGEA